MRRASTRSFATRMRRGWVLGKPVLFDPTWIAGDLQDETMRSQDFLRLSILSSLLIPATGCGDTWEEERCLEIPADGGCLFRRKALRQFRRNDCEDRTVRVLSDGVIKQPDAWMENWMDSVTATAGDSMMTSVDSNFSSTTTNVGSTAGTQAVGEAIDAKAMVSDAPLECCYRTKQRKKMGSDCVTGRPLELHTGHPKLAEVRSSNEWGQLEIALPKVNDLDAESRRILGNHWLELARQEHASIAAFAQLALELIRFGAPAGLLEECQRSQGDETLHAQICFRIASAYLGKDVSAGLLDLPDALPLAKDLGELAAKNLAEGCCNESLSALEAMESARLAEDPAIAHALKSIAEDERRHAAFSWKLLQWTLEQEPGLWQELDAQMQAYLSRFEPLEDQSEELEADKLAKVGGKLRDTQRQAVMQSGVHEVLRPVWAGFQAQQMV